MHLLHFWVPSGMLGMLPDVTWELFELVQFGHVFWLGVWFRAHKLQTGPSWSVPITSVIYQSFSKSYRILV